jgi:hypothetical protein
MANINFNTANQTFRQLLGNGLLYTVPQFQRDYSWGEEEWGDCWGDILQVLEDEPAHYMGYLVLQSKDQKNFDIIDGQQRLTTLSMFVLAVLSALNRLVEEGREVENNSLRINQLRNTFIGYLDPVTLIPRSKLTLNRNNDTYYQNYLVPLEKLPIRNLKATEHLMRKGFEWFKKRVWDTYGHTDGAQLARVIDTIADRFFFTVITVSDELNAYKVFETLNARGVRLSSTDLLKNYFFSVVYRETQDNIELNALENPWSILVDKLGSESFPDFLRTYWNSANKFVRHNELFKVIKNQVNNRQKVFDLIRKLEVDAETYVAFSKPEDGFWTREQGAFVEALKMFYVRQAYPLLMAAKRTLSDEIFTGLLRACCVISFRYNVIGNFPANEQERIYTSTALMVSRGDITRLTEILHELRNIYPNDAIFERDFAEKQLNTNQNRNKRIVRYLLSELEKRASGIELNSASDQHSIEHILPENPDSIWADFSDDDHDQFVYRLGNMCMLKTSDNRDLKNVAYDQKRTVFARSGLKLANKIAEDYSEWTPKQIEDQQKWMASQAKTIWKITQLTQT